MKRFFLSLACALATLLLITGIGSSIFFFGPSSVHQEGQITNSPRIDDIAENYNFTDSGRTNKADYYDVYFFSSPFYARYALYSNWNNTSSYPNQRTTLNSPLNFWNERYNSRSTTNTGDENFYYYENTNKFIETRGHGGEFDGYFPDRERTQDAETDRFGYVKIAAYKGLTFDQYDGFTKPTTVITDNPSNPGSSTARKDNHNWPLRFSGFTYNASIAGQYGFGWQGDFEIINLEQSLAYYDSLRPDGTVGTEGETGIDGSKIGDNIVYLYPVFSAGKNYASSQTPSMINVLTFDGSNTTLTDYWATEINDRTSSGWPFTYFSAYNLTLNDNTGNVTGSAMASNLNASTTGDGIFIAVCPEGWPGDWYFSDTCQTQHYYLLSELSVKPLIYLRGHYNLYAYIQVGNWSYSNTLDSGIENAIKEDKHITYQGYFNFEYNGYYTVFFFIERVYQYKILGSTSTSTGFDYLSSDTYLYSSSTSSYDYESQTIYVPRVDGEYGPIPYTTLADLQGNNSVTYNTSYWANGVITVAAAADRTAYELEIDESSKDLVQFAAPKVDFRIYQNDSDSQISDTDYAKFNNHFLKIKEPGLYVVSVKETFGTVRNEETGRDEVQITKLTVSVRSVPYNATIRITAKDPAKYGDNSLIDPEDLVNEGNEPLFQTIESETEHAATFYLTWKTLFDVSESFGSVADKQVTFREIYSYYIGQNPNAQIVDHVTGYVIPTPDAEPDLNIPILKYYIFYINLP